MTPKTSSSARLALIGLACAVVIFVSLNVLSNAALKGLRFDLTEGELFTLSDGTRDLLGRIDEPITVRLYFSRRMGEVQPSYAAYFARVRELLERYSDLSNGLVRLELHNPEPFTATEDLAVAYGLQGIPLDDSGELGYFGLAATNSVDDLKAIPYLTPQREAFLEYDLTKIVHSLASPKKKVVGILSSLPVNGAPAPGQQGRWGFLEQVADFFKLRSIFTTDEAVPDEVDILLIVHPKGLSERMLYSVDQFVLGGGEALVMVDPNSEYELATARGAPGAGPSDFNRLLEAWGVRLADGKVLADLDTARRVNVRQQGKIAVADYVAWLSLRPANFDRADAVTADIDRINVATAGILESVERDGITVTPLVSTGRRAMRIDSGAVRANPDVVRLFREFKPEGQPLMLAARLSGTAKSAFPDGAPKPKKAAAGVDTGTASPVTATAHRDVAGEPINVIVLADTDMLLDQFWNDAQQVLGQTLRVPYANNADFVVSALENLAGGASFAGLRARSESARPFTMVQGIQQQAELKYRAKERELVTRLEATQKKIAELLTRENQTGGAVVTPEDKQTIDRLRSETIELRRELRDVQHALREDIDRLDLWLKFLNIAAVPLALGVATLALALVRRRRLGEVDGGIRS